MPQKRLHGKRVLVLGAYGFIGAAVTRTLQSESASVTGMVRDARTGTKVLPGVTLVKGDLRDFLEPEDWRSRLNNVDAVVNCAGALQDGGADDLEIVHHKAIAALGQACAELGISIVQISAIGAEPDATTDFMRTKAAGDAALRICGAPVWILKPGLVIGQSDYGGTALLRMLAAIPLVQPIAYPATPVQCIGMDDLCGAITATVAGELPQGAYDLVEDAEHPLSDVLAATRRWLGFPAARLTVGVPVWTTRLVASLADFLGKLGWRSPLRSTAMTVMADGVTGNPEPYRNAAGASLASMDEVYSRLTCAREHRLTARMTLLMPLVIAVLSLFWVLSGVLGLTGLSQAKSVLLDAGWSAPSAAVSVVFWSLVDIALGLALLQRPWAGRVCLLQFAVALFYLVAATVAAPALWGDPLGPLVKILPAMMLSLVAWPMLESR